MQPIFRKLTKRFFVIVNICTAVAFAVACMASYLSPVKWWFIAFMGLAFPYILLLIVGFVIFWAVFRSKWILLNLCLLLAGFTNVSAVFAFHPLQKKFSLQKKPGTLRVLQWNSMSFGEYVKNIARGAEIRDEMLRYIREQDADVLCLQEFFDAYDLAFHQNLKEVTEKLGYPNYYFTRDYERYKWSKDSGYQKIGYWGSIIFSRLPVADSGKINFPPDGPNHESLIYLDVLHNTDTLRIMTTHLQSVKFGNKDYAELEKIKTPGEGALKASKGIFSKIRAAYSNRSQQARLIRDEIKSSPHPVIVTGDFNDVPNSYTYFTIRGGLQDAFLKKGFGIGRTYSAISPTLRIDYILAHKQLKVLQFKKDNLRLSDHYPLVADFEVKQ